MMTEKITQLNIEKIRADFPALNQLVHGKPLVYLDNAATTQKPQCVIDAIDHYYSFDNANVHRGVHSLSQRATLGYEAARKTVKNFINAPSEKEIIFLRGATEAINLVAQSYGRTFLKAGDEIIISHIEHHSNIVPWQLLCEQTGSVLKVIPINMDGELLMDEYEKLLSDKTKIVAVGHISNALGTINPLKNIIAKAKAVGAVTLIDGAQAAPHTKIDVKNLDCDFYTCSGHKMFGPTGIGFLYAREELLEKMPPWHGGGEMIKMVSFDEIIYNDLPHKFEAGTPNIAGTIGLAAAIDYLTHIGLDKIEAYEHELLIYATQKALAFDGLRLIGTAKNKAAILSFLLNFAHAHDAGTILDSEGIAIRSGHHCAMPTMEFFGVAATIRASFTFYNTREEVDKLFLGLEKIREVFQ
jgi:cysteine desulfurase/selenocysteine lyase